MPATRSSAPKAPGTEPTWHDDALVLCGHGIRGGPGVAAAHAQAIARLGLFAEARACAHKGRPGLLKTLAAVRARRIYLLPLLMAEGFTLRAIVARIEAAGRPGVDIRVCPPLGTHPGLPALLAREALAAAARAGWEPAETALLIAGHGTTATRSPAPAPAGTPPPSPPRGSSPRLRSPFSTSRRPSPRRSPA